MHRVSEVKYTFLREKAILSDKPNGYTTYFNIDPIYVYY